MTNKDVYYSEWIKNVGKIPYGVNEDTMIQVKYVGDLEPRSCASNPWDATIFWLIQGNDFDIEMYRFEYSK